jgi:hypothetical protein
MHNQDDIKKDLKEIVDEKISLNSSINYKTSEKDFLVKNLDSNEEYYAVRSIN